MPCVHTTINDTIICNCQVVNCFSVDLFQIRRKKTIKCCTLTWPQIIKLDVLNFLIDQPFGLIFDWPNMQITFVCSPPFTYLNVRINGICQWGHPFCILELQESLDVLVTCDCIRSLILPDKQLAHILIVWAYFLIVCLNSCWEFNIFVKCHFFAQVTPHSITFCCCLLTWFLVVSTVFSLGKHRWILWGFICLIALIQNCTFTNAMLCF